MSLEQLVRNVESWGQNKGIVNFSKEQVLAQIGKVKEELAEVEQAVVEYFDTNCEPFDDTEVNLFENIENELGDLGVTWIMVATCLEIYVGDALLSAYNKISKRTGNVVNGVFVKDG